MKKEMSKSLFFIFLLFFPLLLLGGSGTRTESETGIKDGTTSNIEAKKTQGAGDSMRAAALTQILSGSMNFVAGGMEFKKALVYASATPVPKPILATLHFAMAGLHFGLGGLSFKGANESNNVANILDGPLGARGVPPRCFGIDAGCDVGGEIKALRERGYYFDGRRIKMPDGTTYTPKELISKLKKLDPKGFGEIQKAVKAKARRYQAAYNKAKSQLKLKNKKVQNSIDSNAFLSGERGNKNSFYQLGKNGVERAWDNHSHNSYSGYGMRSFASQQNSLRGLNKVVNGDSIGVKGDDIFELAHRRYVDQNRQNFFIK